MKPNLPSLGPLRDWPWRARVLLLVALTLAAAAVVAGLPRIPQPQAYHQFADQRTFIGIPRCLDVISNLPFLLVGALGIRFLSHPSGTRKFLEGRERWAYFEFFGGVLATSLGSAWYHLEPDNARLLWDRLPMSIAFMGFLACQMAERLAPAVGVASLAPLSLLGAASVFYWGWTESLGRGDLRPYLFVQFFPALAVLLLVLLFPARYTRSADLLGVFVLYTAAKVSELFDRFIFSLGQVVSGHTLKHLSAAAAAYCVLRMLQLRTPAANR